MDESNPVVFEAIGLAVERSGRTIVHGLSFKAHQGRAYAIVGPNGSGKSTVLEALAGLLPFRGSLFHRGAAVSASETPRLRQQRGLGYAPQDPVCFPGLTVLEHFELLSPSQGADQARGKRIHSLLQPLLQARAEELSVGQRRLLSTCLAVWGSPAVLLVDEPFASLTAESSDEVRGVLCRFLSTGGVAMYTAHGANDLVAGHDQILDLAQADARQNAVFR